MTAERAKFVAAFRNTIEDMVDEVLLRDLGVYYSTPRTPFEQLPVDQRNRWSAFSKVIAIILQDVVTSSGDMTEPTRIAILQARTGKRARKRAVGVEG